MDDDIDELAQWEFGEDHHREDSVHRYIALEITLSNVSITAGGGEWREEPTLYSVCNVRITAEGGFTLSNVRITAGNGWGGFTTMAYRIRQG